MKAKELKNIAKQIAKYEFIIQTSDDKKAVRDAQMKVMELSGRVERLEDMVAIDEYVQECLQKKKPAQESKSCSCAPVQIPISGNVI